MNQNSKAFDVIPKIRIFRYGNSYYIPKRLLSERSTTLLVPRKGYGLSISSTTLSYPRTFLLSTLSKPWGVRLHLIFSSLSTLTLSISPYPKRALVDSARLRLLRERMSCRPEVETKGFDKVDKKSKGNSPLYYSIAI